MTIESLGKRVARLRRAAGIRTAAELAAKLPEGSNITTATIQNLESGRKNDLTFGQVVLLARALGVPAGSVIADLRDPFGDSGVPGLTNWDLVGELRDTHHPYSSIGSVEGNRIFAIEELLNTINEWDRDAPSGASDALRLAHERKRERDRIRAREAYDLLVNLGTKDLAWAEGPWLGEARENTDGPSLR